MANRKTSSNRIWINGYNILNARKKPICNVTKRRKYKRSNKEYRKNSIRIKINWIEIAKSIRLTIN